jgi:outer membrane protein assembly factor BamE (lipoprotein component of BamABCDE complex)
MTRRRVLCGLLLASAVLACFAGWLWVASRPRLTRERFEQVKKGMSREEVIRTVGRPSGDYTSGKYIAMQTASPPHELWVCDEAILLVQFDNGDTATRVAVGDNTIQPPTLIERIRRWLGL